MCIDYQLIDIQSLSQSVIIFCTNISDENLKGNRGRDIFVQDNFM